MTKLGNLAPWMPEVLRYSGANPTLTLQLGEGSVVYFVLYDWFDVDDRGAVDGFE